MEGKGIEDVCKDGAFENNPVGEAFGGEVWEVESCVDANGFPVGARVDVGGKFRRGEWAELEWLVGGEKLHEAGG